MGLSDDLRQEAAPIWDRILQHPFVTGIGDGSLSLDRFTYYLRQDYLFLIDYGRALAVATAKAPDLEGMTRFAGLMHATLTEEMDLHRQYCAGFDVTAEDLEATEIAPATSAYGRYLVSIAYEGSIREITAALLPCQWGYCEIGLHLAAHGDSSESNPYAEWIRAYASDEFRALSDWLRAYLDEQAEAMDRRERHRLSEIFLTSSRYEYSFWEMGYHKDA